MWYWSDGEVAPDIEKCTAACEVNSSIGDLATVDQTRIMLTTDLGLLFDFYSLVDKGLPQTVLIQFAQPTRQRLTFCEFVDNNYYSEGRK